MANQCWAELPWMPDWTVVGAFARESMRACFGPAFELAGPLAGEASGEDASRLLWVFKGPSAGQEAFFWKQGPRALATKRGPGGFGALGSEALFEACAPAFGAFRAEDEGVGKFPLRAPGALGLGPRRLFHGGVNGILAMRKAGRSNWGLGAREREILAPAMDPLFFKDLDGSESKALFAGGASDMRQRERMLALDTVRWGARVQWAGALADLWGGPKAPSQQAAESAALPFCALGLEVPDWLARQMRASGAQNALGVALLWKSARSAESLVEAHGGLDAPKAAEWALRACRLAHGEGSSMQESVRALEGIEELAQALALSTAVPGPSSRPLRKARQGI